MPNRSCIERIEERLNAITAQLTVADRARTPLEAHNAVARALVDATEMAREIEEMKERIRPVWGHTVTQHKHK